MARRLTVASGTRAPRLCEVRIFGASTIRSTTASQREPRALRVLHLDHTLAPGGAELALARLLQYSSPWRAALALPRRPHGSGLGAFDSLGRPSCVTLVQLGPEHRPGASRAQWHEVPRTTWSIARSALAIRFSPQFRNADVVHANTSRTAVIASLASVFTRTCVVVHLRDRVEHESLGRFGTTSLGWALGRATGVIANSSSTLATAERYLAPGTERTVIPSPSGLSALSVSPTRAPRPPGRSTVARVVMVARIDPWKGHAVLLEAFAEVFGDTSTRLVLAGGPAFGHDDHLDTLRRRTGVLGLAGQVDFLGHVDDIASLLVDADVCVQASVRPEPLGQNVLQYLAAGRPVIATRAGGPAEWIEDGVNGLLVPMNDPAALARALRRLRDGAELRERLSRNAAETPGLRSDRIIAEEHHRFFVHCAEVRRHRAHGTESR